MGIKERSGSIKLRCFQNVMASVLLAVLLAFPAVAEPALWIIHGTGSTIYLFGTVHALKPSTVWFSP